MTGSLSRPRVPSPAPWSVTFAKVRGASHYKTATPCQDDGLWQVLPGSGYLLLVVSDGAGSGRLSQHASAITVRSCCYALRREAEAQKPLGLSCLQDVAAQAARDVADLHRRIERVKPGKYKLSDFACTLVLAVLGKSTIQMLQIGDGAVVVHSSRGLRCLSPVPNREYASDTIFLTTSGAVDQPFMYEMDASDLAGIAVMSDGVQTLGVHFPSNIPHPGLFDPLFEYAAKRRDSPQNERDKDLCAFLDNDAINEQTDDDKTLILAIRSEEPAISRR